MDAGAVGHEVKLCSVGGCGIVRIKRGMCEKHYRRFMKYGDPLHPRKYATAGTGSPRNDGYWMHEIDGRSVLRHVLVAERAAGHPLPSGAHVHHVDYDRSNDAPSNLVICQDAAYHKLLHTRTDALNACGNANWRACMFCKQYDDPANMKYNAASHQHRHFACWRNWYEKDQRRKHGIHFS